MCKKLSFTTLILLFLVSLSAQFVEVGTQDGTTNFLPSYGYYNYSWSRVIYRSQDINNAVNINGLSYLVTNQPTNYEMLNQKIYLKHTSAETITSTTYINPANDASYSLVFDGTVVYNGTGWSNISLDTEFAYNGTDNLEIFYANRDGTYLTGYPAFAKNTLGAGVNVGLYKYSDASFPQDPGTLVNYYPCIRLNFTDENAPTAATLTAPANGEFNVSVPVSLAWTAGANNETYDLYFSDNQVLVSSLDASALIAADITATSYSITELEVITNYYWRVVSKNSVSDYTASSPIFSFTTPAGEGSLVIGNGTVVNQGLPMEPWFGYTISQSIYLQEWINIEDKRVEQLAYYSNGYSAWTEDNIQIWMAHTDLDQFATTASWLAQDQLTLVYDGPFSVPATEGWVAITLDVPFNYNNTQNLLVAFESNTQGYSGSNDEFLCSVTTGNKSIGRNSDTVNYDFITPGVGTLKTHLPNTMFTFSDIPTTPQLMVNPSQYAWSPTIMGTSGLPATFNMRNTGLGTLVINSVTLSENSAFTLVDTNVYPLEITTNVPHFSCNFMPLTEGDFTANVTILDGSGNETVIPLSGNGYDAMITEFPHFEGFENGTGAALPTDWQSIINSSSTPYINVSTTYPYAGAKALRMYNSSDIAPQDLKLVTPPLAGMSSKRVRFYARASSNGVVLGVGSTSSNFDPTLYTEITNMPLTTEYQVFYVHFDQIPANNSMLCFDFIGDNTSTKTIYIDDVTIEEVPAGAYAEISPTALNYGNVYLNRTGVANLNISNRGAADLVIEITSGGNLFSTVTEEVTIAPGISSLVPISFTPAVEGNFTGSFTIGTNAQNLPSVTITATAVVLAALPEGVAIIGTGRLANQGLPFEPWYRHSYSQSIYQANAIGMAGQRIEKISWEYNGYTAWGPDEIRIFLGHTTATSFSTNTSWIDLDNLSEVFTGTITVPATEGWVETQLNMPFVYDNTQNLVVAVFHSAPQYHSGSDEFYCTQTTDTRSILYYSDSIIPNPASPVTANYMRTSYPNIKLQFGAVPQGADLIVFPDVNNFEMVAVGEESLEKTITMRSIGMADAIIAAPPVITGIAADQFSITTDNNTYPLTLPFLATTTLGVSFNPTSEGTKNATLEIVDNATRITHSITLNGYAFAEDGNDQAPGATLLTLPVNGDTYAIMPIGDIDWYKIPAMGIGDTLLVQAVPAVGSSVSVKAWLYGPVTNPANIVGSQHIANGTNISFVLPVSGDYYLRVAETSVTPAEDNSTTDRKNYDGENGRFSRAATGLYKLFVDANYNYDYSAPFNLVASNSNGFVELTWEEPEYERYLVAYKVFRGGSQINANPIEIGTNFYHDANVIVGNEYSYYVVGVYEEPNGLSLPSNTVAITYFNDGEALWGDNFEDHPDFALNMPNWIQYDLDGGSTYGISNVEFENAGEPMSYIVFNPSATTPPLTDMNPYEGDKFLASFASSEGENDDWIVTPRIIIGTTTVVSFYAKSHTDQYGLEKFKVKMSLGGSQPTNFQYSLHQGVDYLEAPTVWTPFYFNISQLAGNAARFAIQCVSTDAFAFLVDDFRIDTTEDGVENDDSQVVPASNSLAQNYPNPFNPETSISYSLKEAGKVTLAIYNLKGQKVKTLVHKYQEAGKHSMVWNGTDDQGKSVSSGVYFSKIEAGDYTSSRKMILIK